ncbi:hypothetical protein E4O00_00375 [Treponema sp. OMZ 788]|uniref:hypothetical protein n=1 Tax=Treponema sp. OMZ 788 TaxID=2563664 RepID=UPI0020A31C99|nr:hypothetical protein [Treponema sp. OMZ 788]UTC64738.1 hypothetical protein E4O00_00375 [Treponema sp. OMZ 788]
MNLLCVSSIVTSINFRLIFQAGLGKKSLQLKKNTRGMSNVKGMNYPLEDIYTITGLSEEEVGKL